MKMPSSIPSTIAGVYQQSQWCSLSALGDNYERTYYGQVIHQELPAYERFWQLFVLPFRVPDDVWVNIDLAPHHEAVCIHSYSILRASIRAFDLRAEAGRNKELRDDVGSEVFDDFCIWLSIAYDRFKQLCGALYFYVARPTDELRRSLKAWDKHAQDLDPFLGSGIRGRLDAAQDDVDIYRHFIVHAGKFPGGLDRVPTPEGVRNHLLYWSEWAKLSKKGPEKWTANTLDRMDIINQFWKVYVGLANEFWETTVNRMLEVLGDGPYPDHEKVHLPAQASSVGGPHTSGVLPVPLFPQVPSGTTYPPELERKPREGSNS